MSSNLEWKRAPMDEWKEFLSLGEMLIKEHGTVNDSNCTEHTLHHLLAQAKHFLSGLVAVKSFLDSSDQIELYVTYLIDYFHETVIPDLNEKLDFYLSSNSTPNIITQQRLFQNEPIILDMDQVRYLRCIGLTFIKVIGRFTIYFISKKDKSKSNR